MKSTISKSRYVRSSRTDNTIDLPADYDSAVNSLFGNKSQVNRSFSHHVEQYEFNEANELAEKGKYCLQLK